MQLGDAIKELQSVRESLAAETAKRKEAALGQANALKRCTLLSGLQSIDCEVWTFCQECSI